MLNLIYSHVFVAFLSLALLLIKGSMQLQGKNFRNITLLKVLPHISDTWLIVSGLWLLIGFWGFLPMWVIGKVILLGLYVFGCAKYFGKNTKNPSATFFALAVIGLVGAILLGYFH